MYQNLNPNQALRHTCKSCHFQSGRHPYTTRFTKLAATIVDSTSCGVHLRAEFLAQIIMHFKPSAILSETQLPDSLNNPQLVQLRFSPIPSECPTDLYDFVAVSDITNRESYDEIRVTWWFTERNMHLAEVTVMIRSMSDTTQEYEQQVPTTGAAAYEGAVVPAELQ
ncbi:hypothetical protein EDB83DRAFT_1306650 [Lactarius deliciosus]|nr:hypothetical protein EDB83DRAFT_1306650 [Lactarius deliciosus]